MPLCLSQCIICVWTKGPKEQKEEKVSKRPHLLHVLTVGDSVNHKGHTKCVRERERESQECNTPRKRREREGKGKRLPPEKVSRATLLHKAVRRQSEKATKVTPDSSCESKWHKWLLMDGHLNYSLCAPLKKSNSDRCMSQSIKRRRENSEGHKLDRSARLMNTERHRNTHSPHKNSRTLFQFPTFKVTRVKGDKWHIELCTLFPLVSSGHNWRTAITELWTILFYSLHALSLSLSLSHLK